MTKVTKLVKVNTTFRGIDATDALRNYCTEKLSNCLHKFVHHDTEAHAVLRVEKNRQIAEVTVHADGVTVNATEESPDLYSSIDALVDTLAQQLRKNKEKLTNKHY